MFATPRKTIRFDVKHGVASVALPDGRPILRHLTVQRYVRESQAFRRKVEGYYDLQNGSVRFPAKLWVHLLERLLPLGIAIRPRSLYRLIPPVTQVEWTPLSRSFAQSHVWHGALFRKPAQVSTHAEVIELLRMYPTRRVAVFAKNRGEVARWRARLLRSDVPQHVWQGHGRPGYDAYRRPLVYVCSHASLDFCGPLTQIDLAIVPEVGALRDCDQWDAAQKRPHARDYEGLRVQSFPVFGFLSEAEHLSEGEELRLRSIFVQILSPYRDEYQPSELRTIALASALPRFAEGSATRDVLRQALYENEARNLQIAEIASKETGDWMRVLLLVESPLHARQLEKLLPDWEAYDHDMQVTGTKNLIITDACLSRQAEQLLVSMVIDARGRGPYDQWRTLAHPSRVELIHLTDPGLSPFGHAKNVRSRRAE